MATRRPKRPRRPSPKRKRQSPPSKEEPAALDAAARALASRALSEQELDERLRRKGVGDAAREQARETLRAAGYVDDGRFAAARAAVLAGRDSGDALIRDDLERRGVAAEAIADALAALPPEIERARAAIARRGPGALRRLAARGFAPDVLEELGADLVASSGDDLLT
jgi:regulatory protein